MTFSGTNCKDHGICFGPKHLEEGLMKKPGMCVSYAARCPNMHASPTSRTWTSFGGLGRPLAHDPEEHEKALAPGLPALVVYVMGTGIDGQAALNGAGGAPGHRGVSLARGHAPRLLPPLP